MNSQALETFANAVELISQGYPDIDPRKLASDVLDGYVYDPSDSQEILPYLALLEMASAGHGDAVTMAKKMLAKQKNKLRVVK
jgi:hypothetical protein